MADGGAQKRAGWVIGPPGEVGIASTRSQLIVRCLPLGVVVLAPGFISGGSMLLEGRWLAATIGLLLSLVLVAAFGPIFYLAVRQHRCLLTPEGISTCNGYRTTGVWWADVVHVQEHRSGRARFVVVVTRNQTMRLSAPFSGRFWPMSDADFEAKVATIRAWHHAYTPAAVPPMVYPPPVASWLTTPTPTPGQSQPF